MTQSADAVRAAIAELEALPRRELIARFRRLYRADPPRQLSRDLLLRAISWRLQQKACGKQDRALHRRLRSLASELRQTGSIAVTHQNLATTSLKPGTRLVREWQGVIHEVSVAEEGFVYRDEHYRSLSQIARAITGTRWSGPAFFGLNGTTAGTGAGNSLDERSASTLDGSAAAATAGSAYSRGVRSQPAPAHRAIGRDA